MFHSVFTSLIILLAIVSRCGRVQTAEPTQVTSEGLKDNECEKEDELCIESLEAIEVLHKQIDDDHSGNIDQSESDGFFRDELQNTDGFERQSIFHGSDNLISVPDLWHAWKKSVVYNWTVDDVIDWLISSVELPQYSSNFASGGINGSFLPRMAVNNQHFLSKKLNIKNAVHKRKLSLKAMDVVLFGPPKKGHNILKDIALVTSLVIALGGCWFAYMQHKYSQEHVKKMMKDLDSLQKAEDSLSELNEKLQKAEDEQNAAILEKKSLEQKYGREIEKAKGEAERLKSEREGSNLEEQSRLQLAEQELQQVREALTQAENELEAQCYWSAPTELQQWLQYTFEVEQQHFTTKQQAAQHQFASAKDACEKIRKKRTGMLGTLRIAQGHSIDDIDQRIMQARMALEEIRHDLQERQQRWQNIESFCGFPIRSNPGLAKLCEVLYGESGLSSSASNSRLAATSMVAPLNVEEADEDYPPQYPTATAMLFPTKSNGSLRTASSHTGSTDDKPTKSVKWDSSEKVAKYFKKWRIRSLPTGLSSVTQSKADFPGNTRHSPTNPGVTSLAEVKRRQVNMGSTSSLSRLHQVVQSATSVGAGHRDSLDNLAVKPSLVGVGTSSPVPATLGTAAGGTSPVSFQLGSNSPVSSPESPPVDDVPSAAHLSIPVDSSKMPRSKSHGAVVTLQNGNKVPAREVNQTLNTRKSRAQQQLATADALCDNNV